MRTKPVMFRHTSAYASNGHGQVVYGKAGLGGNGGQQLV